MTPMQIADRISSYERRGHSMRYLGSFPSYVPTEGEQERERYLVRAAMKLSLILDIEHGSKKGRRYVFVRSRGRGEDSQRIPLDHRPDVSHMIIGELSTADSEGYENKLPWMYKHIPEFMPMEAINECPLEKLPLPGTEFGVCEKRCRHVHCKETRKIAESLCVECGEPIGYGVEYHAFQTIRGEHKPGFVHAAEVIDTIPEAYAVGPEWEKQHKQNTEIPPMKKREAA